MRCIHTNSRSKSSHRDFRIELVHQLLEYASTKELQPGPKRSRRSSNQNQDQDQDQPPLKGSQNRKKSTYITKNNYFLSNQRFEKSLLHLPVRKDSLTCQWCKVTETDKAPMRSLWSCFSCDVPLCLTDKRNCFFEYHTKD